MSQFEEMAPWRRCPSWDHLWMGKIPCWILQFWAGFWRVGLMNVLASLSGMLMTCGLVLPGSLWGICCGLSRTCLPCDIPPQMSDRYFDVEPGWSSSRRKGGRDVQHLQFCDASWIVVHDDLPMAMLYFHHLVKKGAARPLVLGRIRNFLLVYSLCWVVDPGVWRQQPFAFWRIEAHERL